MSNAPWDMLKANEVTTEIAALYEPELRASRTYNEFKQIKQRRDDAITAALSKRFSEPAPTQPQHKQSGKENE